jgi:hypothetical protein
MIPAGQRDRLIVFQRSVTITDAMPEVKIEGLRELDQALSELPKATARNTLQRALKKGAEHVRDVWQPEVPVTVGHYQHSIIVGPSSKLTGRQKRDAKRDGQVLRGDARRHF